MNLNDGTSHPYTPDIVIDVVFNCKSGYVSEGYVSPPGPEWIDWVLGHGNEYHFCKINLEGLEFPFQPNRPNVIPVILLRWNEIRSKMKKGDTVTLFDGRIVATGIITEVAH